MNQSRVATVGNCFGYNCIINEEFCNTAKQGCDLCTYVHNECTANLDCLKFCSEKAAQEICGGSEEIVETAWWLYLIIAFGVASFLINIGLTICIIHKNNKQKRKLHTRSEKERKDEDESLHLVPSDPVNNIPINNSEIHNQPTAPPDLEPDIQSSLIVQATPDA